MKRLYIILSALTILCLSCFSQSTLVLTAQDIQTCNAIFAEHRMLSEKVPLLEQQVANLENIVTKSHEVDSLRMESIKRLNSEIEEREKKMQLIEKNVRQYKVCAKVGTVIGLVGVLLAVLK